MSKKEFRLVFYMNATDAIDFWGGRAAASPLAYYFHTQKKKRKILLGGQFQFIGLGEYGEQIKRELEKVQPISLPRELVINGDHIFLSKTAYIYQNNDPLFTQAEHQVYWEATIDKIGRFTPQEQKNYRLDALQMGFNTYCGEQNKIKRDGWQALVSKLVRFERPVEKDKCQWKVYGGDWEPRNFWDVNGMPSIPRNNAFVHATTDVWRNFDKSAKNDKLNIAEVTDEQIQNNHIRESLVHELLKMIFARDGWWVNFEMPTGGGRIDFLVKENARDHWKVIEVKLRDNPDAVEQLDVYIKNIKEDVRKNGDESRFWPLWEGDKRCKAPKGVVLCAHPGTETDKEVKEGGFDFDVWTYKITFKDKKLGIEIRDARSDDLIAET
jgi:hypothetical protein